MRGFLVELYGRMRVYSKLLLFTQRFTRGDFPLTLVVRQLHFANGKVENCINNDTIHISDRFDHSPKFLVMEQRYSLYIFDL